MLLTAPSSAEGKNGGSIFLRPLYACMLCTGIALPFTVYPTVEHHNYNRIVDTLQESSGKCKIEIKRGLNTLSTMFSPPEIKSKHYYYYYYYYYY